MYDPLMQLSEAECAAVIGQLFPGGLAGKDVVAEIAPDGWERSPLVAIYHPSVEQVYREAVQMHENLQALRRPDDPRPLSAAPAREEIEASFRTTPVDAPREIRELVGQCLWDIFSDNHDVVAPDGRVVHLGSFRGSGALIAEYLNDLPCEVTYDYMDFYLGTIWVTQRADLTPLYRMIFRRLMQAGFDWTYHFPRLQLVDLRPLREALPAEQQTDWEDYDPSAAFTKHQEEQEHAKQLAEMRDALDSDYREAVEQARQNPPPSTVVAYQSVYGRLPKGWPPE